MEGSVELTEIKEWKLTASGMKDNDQIYVRINTIPPLCLLLSKPYHSHTTVYSWIVRLIPIALRLMMGVTLREGSLFMEHETCWE